MPAKKSEDWKQCPNCNGRGQITTKRGIKQCPTCRGSGKVRKQFHEKLTKEEKQVMGGTGGALFGAAVGGPVGAVVGGILGAALASGKDEENNNIRVK